MAGTISEFDMIVSRFVQIEAFEGMIDGQDFQNLLVGFGDKIPALALGETD